MSFLDDVLGSSNEMDDFSEESQAPKPKRKGRIAIHIKRVNAEVKLSTRGGSKSSVYPARVLLNDFNPKGVTIFLTESIVVGSEIAITLEAPTRFYARAKVVWCMELFADSHVLQGQAFPYRLGLEFICESEEEKKAIKDYTREITSEHSRPSFTNPVNKAA